MYIYISQLNEENVSNDIFISRNSSDHDDDTDINENVSGLQKDASETRAANVDINDDEFKVFNKSDRASRANFSPFSLLSFRKTLPRTEFFENTCQTIYLSIHLSIQLFIHLSIHLSIFLYVYLSIHLSIHLFIHLSIHLSIFLYVYLSIYISV